MYPLWLWEKRLACVAFTSAECDIIISLIAMQLGVTSWSGLHSSTIIPYFHLINVVGDLPHLIPFTSAFLALGIKLTRRRGKSPMKVCVKGQKQNEIVKAGVKVNLFPISLQKKWLGGLKKANVFSKWYFCCCWGIYYTLSVYILYMNKIKFEADRAAWWT